MRHIVFAAALVLGLGAPVSAPAIDPPYQGAMQRLAEILGSLYFLQPLCGFHEENWRAHMADLIALDEPDDDRRQRLAGSFNTGYQSYARLYRSCTPSAQLAMTRLLEEAEDVARDIHSRYAE